MTSSLDANPPALASMWRMCRLGYSHEPGLLVFAFLITLLSAVPDALLALWLKLLADGVLQKDRTLVLVSAFGMAASATLTWLLRLVSTRITRRFRDKVTIALETHVAALQASVPTLAHQERPEYLDRLAVLRNQVFVLDHMYMSLFSTCGWLVRLALILGLLVSIHPALILLALFAVPTMISATRRPMAERRAEEEVAEHTRLAGHVFNTLTTAASGKEVRVLGVGDALTDRRRREWLDWYATVGRVRWVSAAWHAISWAVFAVGYVGAVVFVASTLGGSTGQVLLVLAAGARLSAYVAATMTEVGFLRGIWLDGSRRLVWLENYAASIASAADRPAPGAIRDAITFAGVSFTYPGSSTAALQDVSLRLPAGSVVALVGENGAGKSTLVKLLCKMYEPDTGEIMVDGEPLRRIRTDEWRARISGAFQDFHRFEFRARTSIGLGDLPSVADDAAVRTAVERARATDVVDALTSGLDTQLGSTWPDGVDISFGQWQKLALARGFMREGPLLLVLDEPTAALDAETEHALFSRYADVARSTSVGGITLLVSHRFSTVRMADLIVVMQGSAVVQVGSHDELIGQPGPYAELYTIQADAYR
jgi:ATP-binding cassette, subfamily B, bacterial